MNAVEAKELSKAFGTRKALDGVSFDLPEGAFLSIFGPNGAGKTTLLKLLSTLARPTGGQARVGGIDLKEEPDKARELIGMISHQSMLYPDLTAEENLALYAELYGVADPKARAVELLEAVGLSHRRLDPVRTFSRGMAQRISIARALVHDPAVVFLDEPYSGLDPHAVDIFDSLIEAARGDRTFIMVSHDLAKGFGMCTHALVLARGRVVTFAPATSSTSTSSPNSTARPSAWGWRRWAALPPSGNTARCSLKTYARSSARARCSCPWASTPCSSS